MPRSARKDGLNKFQRFRTSRKESGMKLVRIWVSDPQAPGFAAKARREAELLRGAPEEEEALDFIESAMRDIDDAAMRDIDREV
jgi:hypothetical protein